MGVPVTLSSVPAQTPYVQYVSSSGQTVFPYPFEITQDSDLVCLINGAAQPTDGGYTLSGQGATGGGNLTFATGQTAGTIVTLYRNIAIARITQLAQNGTFFSANFNNEFNRIYLILQQLQEANGFALQIPITNSPLPVTTLTPAAYALKYLTFDANGNPQPGVLTSSGTLTAPIINGLTGAQTAVEASVGASVINPQFAVGNVQRYGADPTGTSDSTSAFQNAINVAQVTCGAVYVPSTTLSYMLTNTLSITAGCRVYGDGYTPYTGGPSGNRGPGSWLQLAHLNVGINVANGTTGLSSVFLERIGTFRNQPVPGSGWAPLAASYDIAVANADIHIRDVMLLNPTNAVLINNQVGARTFIDGLFGQPLTNGINIQLSEDTCRINNVHFWPYWENDNTFVNPWTLANLVALTLARCDDPEISNFFCIFALNPIQFNFNTAVSPQITSRALFNNVVLDQFGAAGVTVITGANGVSFTLNNVVGVAFSGTSTSGYGVLFSGNSAIAQISNCRFSALGSSAVSVSGTSNNVKISSLVCDGYNGANNGSTCIFAGTGNAVVVADAINATATNASALISNPALISYNSTVSGSLQFVSPATTAVITHNLGHTPLQSQLSHSLQSAPTAPQTFWWSAIGSTTATLNMSATSAATVFGTWTIDSRNTV